MSLAEDLSADLGQFFDADEFAVSATLDGVAVTGIFDNPRAIDPMGGGIVAAAPSFQLPTASVPAAPVGKPLVHAGVSYTVRTALPDGTGVTLLELEA